MLLDYGVTDVPGCSREPNVRVLPSFATENVRHGVWRAKISRGNWAISPMFNRKSYAQAISRYPVNPGPSPSILGQVDAAGRGGGVERERECRARIPHAGDPHGHLVVDEGHRSVILTHVEGGPAVIP